VTFCLGAIHKPQPLAIRPLSARASVRRMTAPKAVDWHKQCPADDDALGNDEIGNCVPIADWRIIQIRHAVVWGDDTKPSQADIMSRYTMLTGFDPQTGEHDMGTDTVTDMYDWSLHGIRVGNQTVDIPYWAIAHPHNRAEVNYAVAHCGPVAVTLNLPTAAQDLSTWAKAPGFGSDWDPGSWGAHRVVSGKYDADIRTIRSWGLDIDVHPEWWAAYAISVDITLSRGWMDTTGLTPSGLDYDALRADLYQIAAPDTV